MPGLVGFFDETSTVSEGKIRLHRMIELLTHQTYYESDNIFIRDGFYGSRSHKPFIQQEPQPFVSRDLYIWFDGEVYNRDYFGQQYDTVTDPEFFASMYHKNEDFSFLKDIDGVFSAVLYDTSSKKIYFITDRHGFKLLFFHNSNGRLSWFSEAKGVLALDYYSPKINKYSVHDFFNQGYLRGNKSWFEDVELFPPASVVCWDTHQKDFTNNYAYWSWNDIKTSNENINEVHVIEQMGSYFKKAVEKRASPHTEICIPLSGGLDSRAIVAAFPEKKELLHTYTFGKKHCWDIQIAKEISKIKGANHHTILLNKDNWLDHRIEGVWWSDGQMNLKHMHVLKLLYDYSKKFKISLNGFLGAAIMGGYYLEIGEEEFQEKILNRGRRFINEGSRLGDIFGVFYRRPFIDNQLLEYTLSQPPKFRKNSHLYNQMLLNEFPEYYNSYFWQRTGRVISTSRIKSIFNRKIHALRNRSINLLKTLGIQYPDNKHYHDYPVWIRKSSDFVDEILLNQNAIYPEYIAQKNVLEDWKNHQRGKDRSERVCAYLTFEIYLQQIFEKKYRPEL